MARKSKQKASNSKKEAPQLSKKERRQELNKATPQKWVMKNLPIVIFGGIFIVILMLVLSQGNDSQTTLGATEGSVEGPIVEMIYFHLPTCPHCIEQNKFNEKLIEAYPNLKITRYNMQLRSSQEKVQEYMEKIPGLENERIGTPLTIIGDQYNIGYGTPETTGIKLSQMIDTEIDRLNSLEITNSTN